MRHKLWLLSAFTVAATLALGAPDSEAAPKTSSVTVAKPAKAKKDPSIAPAMSIAAAYAMNTKNCPPEPPEEPYKKWGWKTAKLTALLVQQPDGSYTVTELPGAKNPDEKSPIASIAKMMTALVLFDLIKQGKFTLDQKIPVTQESLCLKRTDNYFAVEGLPAGITEINADHAMGQMIKKSSNTMAVNLAIAAAGSVERFVELMNVKAKEIGMHDTHFKRPDGLPIKDRKLEYTTARDLVTLAKHLLPYMEDFKKYETEPLKTWTLPEAKDARKDKLRDQGFVFKTGTIFECASLFTIAERGEYVPQQGRHVVVNVQLCDTAQTRYQNTFAGLKAGFKHLGNMVISSAVAADRPPTAPAVPKLE